MDKHENFVISDQAVLCLDLGGTNIKSAIYRKGELHDVKETPSDGAFGGPFMLKKAEELIRTYADQDYSFVGIASTGQVHPISGKIMYANENVPDYSGTDLKAHFGHLTGKPAAALNDVHAAALGESRRGAGQDLANFLCLTYGTGVGGAIIWDKKLVYGRTGAAGEFGHMTLHPGGIRCGCGQRGCYEAYASVNALIRRARDVHARLDTGRKVFEALDEGDRVIHALVDDWIEDIVTGLASLSHIFNPEAVVLGGGVMERQDVVGKIRELLTPLLNEGQKGVEVRQARLGNRAGLMGAACHALDQLG